MWATTAGTPAITAAGFGNGGTDASQSLVVSGTCSSGTLGTMAATIGAGKGFDTEKIKAGMAWTAWAAANNNANECTV